LKNILAKHIEDKNISWLLDGVIGSFSDSRIAIASTTYPVIPVKTEIHKKFVSSSFLDPRFRGDDRESKDSKLGKTIKEKIGLPLGNLTSQLLVNIYMNKFDQFVKHELKTKHYIRYADDFVVFSEDRKYLENLIGRMGDFLKTELKIDLHPNKISLKTLNSGVDFLGWINFFGHRILRTTAKRRMLKKIKNHPSRATVNSYLGLLRHGNTERLRDELLSLKLSR
jgi:hypothetical protein